MKYQSLSMLGNSGSLYSQMKRRLLAKTDVVPQKYAENTMNGACE